MSRHSTRISPIEEGEQQEKPISKASTKLQLMTLIDIDQKLEPNQCLVMSLCMISPI
jgi:hypothetical protein